MQALAPDSTAVVYLPVGCLRTSFAALRSSAVRTQAAEPLAELPLRAIAQDDGSFEVVDGFKRLARWLGAGATEIPVVLESARGAPASKALVLRSNAPARTLTAMDEARVIDSLVCEDGLTLAAIARLLGRRKAWVARRHALATRLVPAVQERLDEGRIGPSLAYAISALPAEDQEPLLGAVLRDPLKDCEALILVAAYRATDSERERLALLRDPLSTVRPEPEGPSAIGSLATRLEERLDRMRQALLDLSAFELPRAGLTDAERRRLEAQHHALLQLLGKTARALVPQATSDPEDPHDARPEDTSRSEPRPDADIGPAAGDAGGTTGAPPEQVGADRGAAPADRAPAPAALREPGHRPPRPAQPQDRPPHPLRGRLRPGQPGPGQRREQARAVPPGD
jgi:hypothetical protein